MKIPTVFLMVLAAWTLLGSATVAAEPAAKIAWYGTLSTGLEEAARSERPILLVSAAPHCLGVPGIW